MPRLNVVLMILLSIGVSAGAALLALNGKGADPAQERIAVLMRRLGDTDPDVHRDAVFELKKLGPQAQPALEVAAKGTDPVLAERAVRLLTTIRPTEAAAVSSRPDRNLQPVEAVSGQIEFSLQVHPSTTKRGEPLRVYLAFANGSTRPVALCRHLFSGKPRYRDYASLEIVDAKGRVTVVDADAWDAVADGAVKEDVVIAAPGSTLGLFEATITLPTISKGPVQVRFIYEAGEGSDYAKALARSDAAAHPLPSGRIISNTVTVTLE